MLSPTDVSRVDKKDMLGIIHSLPEQLLFGLDQASSCELPKDLRHIFIVGMGGSGIAGDVFAAWSMDRRATAIDVVRDYRLPSFAGEDDTVLALSYSGDTEETLSAASEALRTGCTLVGVSSGGKLTQFCKENRSEVVSIPKGYPPRGAFGYLFGAVLGLCRGVVMGDVSKEVQLAVSHIEERRAHLGAEKSIKENRAKALALKLHGKTPIIYGSLAYAPIARRWQTEFNEMAKVLAWASCFPEADHNEIEGWGGDSKASKFAPILLRDPDESVEMRRRLDATKTIVSKRAKVIEIEDDGESLLGRMLSALLLGDMTSIYMAVLRGIDPYPVPSIHRLKGILSADAEGQGTG